MSKRILIIYEKFGMGHERMANIMQDILKEDNVEFVKHAGSDMAGTNDIYTVVKIWNYFIRKNWIKAVDILLNFFVRIATLPLIEIEQVNPIYKKLELINPDIIICTADSYNKVIATYAKEKNISFYIVITEISIFNDLVNPYAIHVCYFKETAAAIHSYDFDLAYFSHLLKRSMSFGSKLRYVIKYYKDYVLQPFKNSIFRDISPVLEQKNNARVEVIGALSERKHFVRKDKHEVQKMLGIPCDHPTVLVASGSIGGKFLTDITRMICSNCMKSLNLLVMCGNDKDIYQKIMSMGQLCHTINIMPFEYVNNFNDFLSSADCIIMRPSAGIFIEALLHRVPSVALYPVTSNDKGALSIIETYNIGEISRRKADLVNNLTKILDKNAEYRANIDRFLSEYPSSYEEIKDKMNKLVYEDSPVLIDR